LIAPVRAGLARLNFALPKSFLLDDELVRLNLQNLHDGLARSWAGALQRKFVGSFELPSALAPNGAIVGTYVGRYNLSSGSELKGFAAP